MASLSGLETEMIIQIKSNCPHYFCNGFLKLECVHCGRTSEDIINAHDESTGKLRIKPNDGKGFYLWVKPYEGSSVH